MKKYLPILAIYLAIAVSIIYGCSKEIVSAFEIDYSKAKTDSNGKKYFNVYDTVTVTDKSVGASYILFYNVNSLDETTEKQIRVVLDSVPGYRVIKQKAFDRINRLADQSEQTVEIRN